MNIEIAKKADIEELSTLLAFLFEQEVEFAPDTELQRHGLSMIIANPEIGEIVILKHDGRIIGMTNLLYTISTALGGRVALLEDMIIHPDHRNGGAGTALIQAAIGHARQKGCKRITLLTDHDNQSAQRFYRRNGFELSSMAPMRRILTQDCS